MVKAGVWQNPALTRKFAKNMEKMEGFCRDENGAEVMEVAVYAGLFILLAMVGLATFGTAFSGLLNKFVAKLGEFHP
jgi:Flp pilus assembly pilin Flp